MKNELLENIIFRWNIIDDVFLHIDLSIKTIGAKVAEHIEAVKEVDTETMIEAATKHLKSENEELKETFYPKRLVKDKRGNYICPNSKCDAIISMSLIENYKIKHCPDCGQRIYKRK